MEKTITLTVTESEYKIISSALNYRAGTLIVSAMSGNSKDRALMESINDLGFKLDQQGEDQS